MNYSIRTILVPIDLSEHSLNALETAVALAKKHKAVLCMLNICENSLDNFSEVYNFRGASQKNHMQNVITALAGAIQHANDIEPTIIQEEGNVVEKIIKTALSSKTDLIVMGTHGASGYRDGFIGSTCYGVMKYSVCPVLTIPPRKKYSLFKKVMFPIRPIAGALLRYDVVSHFLSGSASMNVLGLSNRGEKEPGILDKIINEIKDKLDDDNVSITSTWSGGMSIADDVLMTAYNDNTDLIVLTSLLDVTTKPHFIGPHAQKIINCSRVPVLSIKKISVVVYA